MNYFSFKKQLTLTSLLVLGSLWVSPATMAMLESDDFTKIPTYPMESYVEERDQHVAGLITLANAQVNPGDMKATLLKSQAQKNLLTMYYNGVIDPEYTFDAKAFFGDNSFSQRCSENPEYAYYVLFNDVKGMRAGCTTVSDEEMMPTNGLSGAFMSLPQAKRISIALMQNLCKNFRNYLDGRKDENTAKKLVNLAFIRLNSAGESAITGVSKKKEGKHLLKMAVKEGNDRAALMLANLYYYNSDQVLKAPKKDKALNYLLQASQAGYPDAFYTLYEYSDAQGQRGPADAYKKGAALRGHEGARIDLGMY